MGWALALGCRLENNTSQHSKARGRRTELPLDCTEESQWNIHLIDKVSQYH